MTLFEESVNYTFPEVKRLDSDDFENDHIRPYGGWGYFDRSSDGPCGRENRDELGSAAVKALFGTIVQKSEWVNDMYGWVYGFKDFVTLDWEFSDALVQKKLHVDHSPSKNSEKRKTKVSFGGDINSDYLPVLDLTIKRSLWKGAGFYISAEVPFTSLDDPGRDISAILGLKLKHEF
jgi:hypothetical protein